jgi:hypothetical protein
LTGGRDGAIPLVELAAIAKSVQETVDRIARWLHGRSGPGRPPAHLAKLATLEAVAIESEGTVLCIEAPREVEGLPIEILEADAGVQATQLFVHSVDVLSRGDEPTSEIGKPAARSLRAFVRSVENYDEVLIEATAGDETATARFVPRLAIDSAAGSEETPELAGPSEFVGKLYEVNLHTHTYRIRDELGTTRFVRVGGNLDDRHLARTLLGEIVHVVAEPAEGGEGPDRLVATSIQRVEPPKTGDYYTWDLATALAGIEPIDSIEDLRIPGLDDDEYDSFWHAVND